MDSRFILESIKLAKTINIKEYFLYTQETWKNCTFIAVKTTHERMQLLVNKHFITETRKERLSLKNKRSSGKDKRFSDQNKRVYG